jgi:cell division protein FtsN
MSLFSRPRRPGPGRRKSGESALGGRGIAIAVLVTVSSASFALGFFVGRAAEREAPAEVITLPIGPEETAAPEAPKETEKQQRESLRPVLQAPYPPPGREENHAVIRQNPEGHDEPGTADTYSVQVGAYSDNTDAEKIQENLLVKGYNAYIVKSTDRGRKTIYRVRVGDFNNKADAKRMVLKLKRLEGKSTFISEGR